MTDRSTDSIMLYDTSGRLAQLARAPARHAGGHWFESSTAQFPSPYHQRVCEKSFLCHPPRQMLCYTYDYTYRSILEASIMPRSRPTSNPISYHKHTRQYYVTRGGRRIYLGSDKEQALEKYHRLGLGLQLGPDVLPPLDLTRSPVGRSLSKLKPVPPPAFWMRADCLIASKIASMLSSTGSAKHALSIPSLRPAFIRVAHEMVHKNRDRMPKDKKVRETEAEAVAFVVCHGVGLETNGASSDYIQLYDGDRKTLLESLERIQRTAAEILDAIAGDSESRFRIGSETMCTATAA